MTNYNNLYNIHNKKRKLVLFILLIIIIILIGVFVIWLKGGQNTLQYGRISSLKEVVYNYDEYGNIKFIDGPISEDEINSSEDVLKVLEENKDLINYTNIEEFSLESINESEGITYYRYNQIYEGIPVLNQNIIISVNSEKKFSSFSGYYIPNLNISTTPLLSEEEASNIAKNYLGENSTITSSELVIWAEHDDADLVYQISGYSNTMLAELLIDANTGEIINVDDKVVDAAYVYTGLGLDNKFYTINLEEYNDLALMKTRYRFYDPMRNISIADYRNIGEIMSLISIVPGTTPIAVDITNNQIDVTEEEKAFIQSAITTMANYATIYDYYLEVLNRNSYDNKGSKIIINLGVTAKTFSDADLNNAAWNRLTNQMYIGNYNGKSFSASLDVLAHEFTHGVISHTADFASSPKKEDRDKAFETGALDEAYADILGSLIEGKNWTIAENNETLRDLSHPETFRFPSIKGGEYYYPDGYLENRSLEQFLKDNDLEEVYDYDKGGVHQNANVVGHAAYLMEKNQAFESKEQMAKVWYNSLFLLSSYSNFEDCALAVIKSAKNLGLSESAISIITQAFIETNILEEKEYKISGSVKSDNEPIENVQIEFRLDDNSLIKSVKTDENGNYSITLPANTYTIGVSKEGFEEFSTTFILKGNTNLIFYLTSLTDDLKKVCTRDDCYNFTIYYLEEDNDKLIEKHETYAVDAGEKLDVSEVVNYMNKMFGANVLKTDGTSFYMTVLGFTVEFGWYYKDTNTQFDWNKPITEDVEIEMKIFDGLLDNNFFEELESFFN